MKQKATDYEVLLFTDNSFSKREWCSLKAIPGTGHPQTRLQQACWNGLVFELLPDVIEHTYGQKTAYTWEVIPANHFIEIKIGSEPFSAQQETSINPYWFYSTKHLN